MITPSDGPPLDPSSPVAQQWLRGELANGRYHAQPSLMERFLAWLLGLFNGPQSGPLPSWLLVVGGLVLLAAVAIVVAYSVRREPGVRRARGSSAAVDDEGLSAEDYRRRAHQASARQDWDAMLLDSYRALAASAVERALLAELPGRTAHEVAVSLAPAFPEHREALARAAAAFDDVRYGHRSTSELQARATAEVDARLLRARPRLDRLVSS